MVPLFLALAGNGCSSCRKDDPPPPPMPEAVEPSASPPSTVVLVPPIEDAGDEADSAADAKPGTGKPTDFTGLRNCCSSLAANAASMPPPQNLYAANAAAFCSAGVASVVTPGARDQLLAGIRNAMRGTALPAACH